MAFVEHGWCNRLGLVSAFVRRGSRMTTIANHKSRRGLNRVSLGFSDCVVLLGWDPHLFRACVSRGHRAVVIRDVSAHLRGGDPLPESFYEVVVDDIADIGGIWAGLTRLAGSEPGTPLGVLTTNEFAVCAAAMLGEMFGLPRASLSGATRMRDKDLQKQAVRAAGLPAADSAVVIPGSTERAGTFPGPCVIKPLAGAGTAHTQHVRTASEYEATMRRLATIATSPMVVETFIDAREEWFVDGVVQDGCVVFSSVGCYSEPNMVYVAEHADDWTNPLLYFRMDGTGQDARCAEARAMAGKALAALGYRDGVFHMELLLESTSDTLYFGECAARRGGGMIEEEVVTKHSFSLAEAAVDVAVGTPVSPPTTMPLNRHVGTTYLNLPRGTIIKLPDPKRFCAPDYVHDLYVSALLGVNDTPSVRTSAQQQAKCVVSGKDAAELRINMRRAQEDFIAQSLVAPTFGTKAEQRAFMATYEDAWRRQLCGPEPTDG
jgi:biotin carboxylase